MAISSPSYLGKATPKRESLNSELLLRYSCATLVTWIALAGGQLVMPTAFALALGFIALLGMPVSLYLRLNDMRVGRVQIPRPLWNGITTTIAFGIAAIVASRTVGEMASMLSGGRGGQSAFWLKFGAGESLVLLMQIFLLFAAFRSFALISDKDATLTTVPSFSVLLLLIPVQRGLEVVLYFVIWMLTSAALFALDHRAEQRDDAIQRIPANIPGQDVKMATRSLVSVLGFALSVALALSYFLTWGNVNDRSATESAISSIASRVTSLALSLPDGSSTSGPERQIDFSSGPSLPSRAVLWTARAMTYEGKTIRPPYWRMFTLSLYNGSSWLETTGQQKQVPRRELSDELWPWPWPRLGADAGNGANSSSQPSPVTSYVRTPILIEPRFRDRPQSLGSISSPTLRVDSQLQNQFASVRDGYLISAAITRKQRASNVSTVRVRQTLRVIRSTVGFIPSLPDPIALKLRDNEQKEVRARPDGSIEVGFLSNTQAAFVLSNVPRLPEYGFSGQVPSQSVNKRADSPQLTSRERKINLGLPSNLPPRVADLAKRILRQQKPGESNYRRAQRLAFALQQDAVYTLRPPSIPEGRDATDFFLFDARKRGYCTYFAGALAVLCRTQGIPARVVSGFAADNYDSSDVTPLIEANAHAWTEIWVENWGWAVVDATPADNRGENAPNWAANWSDWAGYVVTEATFWVNAHKTLLTVALLLLFTTLLTWKFFPRLVVLWRRLKHIPNDDDWDRKQVITAYEKARQDIARHFRLPLKGETPDEWLNAVIDVATLTLQAESKVALADLTELYINARYSPHALKEEQVNRAAELARTRWRFERRMA